MAKSITDFELYWKRVFNKWGQISSTVNKSGKRVDSNFDFGDGVIGSAEMHDGDTLTVTDQNGVELQVYTHEGPIRKVFARWDPHSGEVCFHSEHPVIKAVGALPWYTCSYRGIEYGYCDTVNEIVEQIQNHLSITEGKYLDRESVRVEF